MDQSPKPKSRISEIINTIPDIIAEVDNNKTYTWLNKAGLDFFGSDAIGNEASFYFEGEQQTYVKVEPLFNNQADTYYLESWQRRADGQKRLLAWRGRTVKDESGKTIGVLSTARDITEQKINEEKLQESETQLYNALKLGNLGPWVYDVKQNLFTFNDLFYEMLHTSAKEMGGYQMTPDAYAKKFVHPDDAPQVGIETKKALETKDPNYTQQLDHRIIYADGGLGYITVRISIVQDEAGNTVKTYGVNQDITDRKKNEEEVKRMNKLMIGRELKMKELKNQVTKLEQGLQPKNNQD
ncbi:MAG: hypothetical protein A2427_04600 [Candidatus Nealsonbacteria bacterium RIFOXYC1_FULL_40_7]|uniref:histidine kinase n=1 Tax=Candidatus Nealsonbacteria bacterium RIFOXYC1_FULL_40_7 TaxID=1801678 RepID=A0A1G2ETB9_9BACT|nr:MAG: hypothetical protein A2427_04600 [Candidatus Nealsonbacteria bacterium RIFOXYC1_FULL_40_7]